MIEGKAGGFARDFSGAIRSNDDPQTVSQALPSFLLMLDALVRGSPESKPLLAAVASMNGAYAGSFISDRARASAVSDKAMGYAFKLLCLEHKELCAPRGMSTEDIKAAMTQLGRKDVQTLYLVASVWAGWIQLHSEDWSAIADLSRVETLMRRVVEIDDSYEKGMPQLYLGVLATVLPPALGGRPEEGRQYFERALKLSGNQNLMVKVYYARQYARGVFDRELHDRLLAEVIQADAHAGEFTLSNMLAKQEAVALLKSADEYF